VDKKTPLNGIPEMPGADLLDSTCLPSYQTVIWPVDLFTDCWMEWVLPSGESSTPEADVLAVAVAGGRVDASLVLAVVAEHEPRRPGLPVVAAARLAGVAVVEGAETSGEALPEPRRIPPHAPGPVVEHHPIHPGDTARVVMEDRELLAHLVATDDQSCRRHRLRCDGMESQVCAVLQPRERRITAAGGAPTAAAVSRRPSPPLMTPDAAFPAHAQGRRRSPIEGMDISLTVAYVVLI
jgi:hypothetical protein